MGSINIGKEGRRRYCRQVEKWKEEECRNIERVR
jgi:hypothetical protein